MPLIKKFVYKFNSANKKPELISSEVLEHFSENELNIDEAAQNRMMLMLLRSISFFESKISEMLRNKSALEMIVKIENNNIEILSKEIKMVKPLSQSEKLTQELKRKIEKSHNGETSRLFINKREIMIEHINLIKELFLLNKTARRRQGITVRVCNSFDPSSSISYEECFRPLAESYSEEEIEFRNNEFGYGALESFNRQFKQEPLVESLKFIDCYSISNLPHNIKDVISCNNYLKYLVLSNSNIQRYMFELCNALTSSTSIKLLNLSNNNISLDGAKHLGGLFKRNNKIQILRLENNAIDPHGFERIMNGINQHSSTHYGLKELYISNNKIDSSHPDVLAKISQLIAYNKSLKTLDLENNDLIDEYCNPIEKILLENTTLLNLKITLSKPVPHQISAIANALKINKSLQVMFMNKSFIDDSGIIKISESLCHNQSLLALDLSGNKFTITGRKALYNAIKSIKSSLQYLGRSGACSSDYNNPEYDEIEKSISMALETNKKGAEIFFTKIREIFITLLLIQNSREMKYHPFRKIPLDLFFNFNICFNSLTKSHLRYLRNKRIHCRIDKKQYIYAKMYASKFDQESIFPNVYINSCLSEIKRKINGQINDEFYFKETSIFKIFKVKSTPSGIQSLRDYINNIHNIYELSEDQACYCSSVILNILKDNIDNLSGDQGLLAPILYRELYSKLVTVLEENDYSVKCKGSPVANLNRFILK